MSTNSPVAELKKLLLQDKHDIGVLLVYTLITGFLSLVVPIGTQALINTITAGVFLQPLVVLSFLVFIGLILFGFFQIIQISIVEKLQQRIFAKVAINLAQHIPNIKVGELKSRYAPDMANRYFDIMTVQKALSKILLQWPSAVLQIILGLILIWLYSIYLLVFSLIILGFFYIVYRIGFGAIGTSIKESTEKYNVANWLEDLARCHFAFKMNYDYNFLNSRTDKHVFDYLVARKKHFKIIFRQYIAYYFFYALASTGVLAIGGLLVIEHQLSLGQLIASEIIIINVLRASESLITFFDSYYDLLAALEKIKSVMKLKVESNAGMDISNEGGGLEVVCKNISYQYDKTKVIDRISFDIKSGQRIGLIGKSGSGKTTLALLLSGALESQEGMVLINDIDIREYNLRSLRSNIAIIGNANEIFRGTIEENILIGNPKASKLEVQNAVKISGLYEDLEDLKYGLQTELLNEGVNISLGQRLRILLARAVIKKPGLLILDEAILSTDEITKNTIIKNIFSKDQPWSVLDISYDYDSVSKCDYVYVIENSKIIDHGLTDDIFAKEEGYIRQFFEYNRIKR